VKGPFLFPILGGVGVRWSFFFLGGSLFLPGSFFFFRCIWFVGFSIEFFFCVGFITGGVLLVWGGGGVFCRGAYGCGLSVLGVRPLFLFFFCFVLPCFFGLLGFVFFFFFLFFYLREFFFSFLSKSNFPGLIFPPITCWCGWVGFFWLREDVSKLILIIFL